MDKNVTWDDITSLIVQSDIKEKYKDIDIIACIGTGGMVPGVIISKILNKPIINLGVKSYAINNTQTYNAEWYQKFVFRKSKHHNVLVVDDINDSGYTLITVNSYLMSLFYTETHVKFLTVYMKPHTIFNCDYLQEVENDTWIKFPWEVNK